MPSLETTTSFTLSFGGIEFQLDPQRTGTGIQMNHSTGNELVFQLTDFTGVLKVSKNGAVHTQQTGTPAPSQLAVVDDPPSPQGAFVSPKKIKSPQQKQLSFAPKRKRKDLLEKKKNETNVNLPDSDKITDEPSETRQAEADPKSPTKKKARSRKEEPEGDEPPMQQASQADDDDGDGDGETVDNEDAVSIETLGEGEEEIEQTSKDVKSSQSHEHETPVKQQMPHDAQNNDKMNILEVCSFQEVTSSQDEVPPSQSSIEERIVVDSTQTVVTDARKHIRPKPRWGHTMTRISNNRAILYGGQGHLEDFEETIFNDVHIYNIEEDMWSKPINCEGLARQWHSTTYIPERQLLISFGGETLCPKRGTRVTQEVMVLDTEIFLWYPPTCSGDVPSGRSGHSATVLTNSTSMVVFGGVRSGRWTNTMAVLDTLSWKWVAPKTQGDAPRPRSYHSSTPVPREGKSWLVIFGGNNKNQSFNTVHCLETDGKTWTWINPVVSGDIPAPRTGHSATLLSDKRTILIHGGWDTMMDVEGKDMVFGDSYLLDTSNWTWTKNKVDSELFGDDNEENSKGPKRVGHCSILTSDGVLSFGGRNTERDDVEFCDDLQIIRKT